MPEGSINKTNLKIAIFVVVTILIFAGGAVYYYLTMDSLSTDDAFVDGHMFSVTPRISGYVVSVNIDDNQEVQQGSLLMTLDRTEYEVAVAEAMAKLAESRSTLTSLELGVPLELSQAEQKVRGAESELNALSKNLEIKTKDQEAAPNLITVSIYLNRFPTT